MKTHFFLKLLAIVSVIFIASCKKEFDTPPLKTLETTNKINIAQIKSKFNNANYRFKSDSSLYCVVIADEVSGNLYKDIYVKDVTGALHVKLISSGGLFFGDSIRINLQNCILNDYNDLIQLDSVDSEKSIVKLASGLNPQPVTLTIKQIIANTAASNSVQSKLVQINNVEFASSDMDVPFADATGKTSVNRIIKSCDGSTLTVRTSGYSSFASKNTPKGNGSFVGIVGQFGSTMQMIIRNLNDLNMNGSLCTSGTPTGTGNYYLSKDFNDNSVLSGGWQKQNVVGNTDWSTGTFGGQTLAKISNYNSTTSVNATCETWLISPIINLSFSTTPILTFQNAYKFNGAPLELYVSTNYNSGLPNTGTWTKLNFTLSPGNFTFVSSGIIPLSNYKTSNTRIAFKYLGSSSDGSTWEIDDVIVKEN